MGKRMSIGQRSGKRNKNREKTIPPDSPLGQMLANWEEQEKTKELDKVKIIYFCMVVWPKLDLKGIPLLCPWRGDASPLDVLPTKSIPEEPGSTRH